MVRAIRERKKTMTRRVIRPQPRKIGKGERLIVEYGKLKIVWRGIGELWETETIRNIPYNTGDILWVRETWLKADDGFHYKANATLDSEELRKAYGYKWRPSIFMPREAARIFLEITDVRIERLQDITESDARAEGFNCLLCKDKAFDCPNIHDFCFGNYETEGCFSGYWEKLNSGRGFGWHKNPWVYAINFRVVSP
jgi:hypothetical protein